MPVNIDCFMLFVTLWKTAMDSGFLRTSCDRKRRAVAAVEIVVLPEMGLSLVIRWHQFRGLQCQWLLSGQTKYCAIVLLMVDRFGIAATDYFQRRNLSLSWNQDLKFLVIGCFYLYFGIDSAVQPNSLLTWQGSS